MNDGAHVFETPADGNVFADLGLPDAEEHMRKARIAIAIEMALHAQGLTDAQAAHRIGVDCQQLRAILRGAFRGEDRSGLLSYLHRLGYTTDVDGTGRPHLVPLAETAEVRS